MGIRDIIVKIDNISSTVEGYPSLFKTDFDKNIIEPLTLQIDGTATPFGIVDDTGYCYIRTSRPLPAQIIEVLSVDYEGPVTWEHVQREMNTHSELDEFCRAFDIQHDQFNLKYVII